MTLLCDPARWLQLTCSDDPLQAFRLSFSLERLSCPAGHRLLSGATQWHHLLRIGAWRNSQTPTGSETKRARLHKEPKCPCTSAFVTFRYGNKWWRSQDGWMLVTIIWPWTGLLYSALVYLSVLDYIKGIIHFSNLNVYRIDTVYCQIFSVVVI